MSSGKHWVFIYSLFFLCLFFFYSSFYTLYMFLLAVFIKTSMWLFCSIFSLSNVSNLLYFIVLGIGLKMLLNMSRIKKTGPLITSFGKRILHVKYTVWQQTIEPYFVIIVNKYVYVFKNDFFNNQPCHFHYYELPCPCLW